MFNLKNALLKERVYLNLITPFNKFFVFNFWLSLLLFGSLTSAQNLGIRLSAGANVSRPLGNEYLVNQSIESGYGFLLEGGLAYTISKKFGMEAGVLFSRQNYATVNTAFSAIRSNYQDSFVEVPLLLSYRVLAFKKTTVNLLSGIYGSYWLSNRSEGLYANLFNNEWNPDTETEVIGLEQCTQRTVFGDQHNRFLVGFQAGLGARRPLLNTLDVGLRAFIRQDLSNRLTSADYNRRYQRFSLEATLFYKLQRHTP